MAKKDKLTGSDYRQFWIQRAAVQGARYVGRKGMTPVAVEAQAASFWAAISPHLPPEDEVRVATEFGCGWGRMTRLLELHYAGARVCGIDFVPESVARAAQRFKGIQFACADHYPRELPDADLIMTCTCIQHVTDVRALHKIQKSFQCKLKPGGQLVMLENVATDKMSPHMAGIGADDYPELFQGFSLWTYELLSGDSAVDRQPHAIITARRREKVDDRSRPSRGVKKC